MPRWPDRFSVAAAAGAILLVTLAFREWLHLTNPTIAALAHVLENAAQYSPPGTPIAVSARVSPDGLELHVRDRGPGIAEADLPRRFDRFYRGTESRRRVAGTGMGLSIARGMLA
jgi:signal transduction histidine kinase